MQVMTKKYYHDDGGKVTVDGFDFKHLAAEGLKNVTHGNTLKLNKKDDSFSTFDDGLLFQFPPERYEHLSYYCRTSTP